MDTGFRGTHQDAAMPPPSADHASMEDGDPHPCPEDEEFFECRPDAADMEEAIGKFMEGMEKQERTGYAALHKLLEGRKGSHRLSSCFTSLLWNTGI